MITAEKLTPMLRMTDAEIDACLMRGLYGRDAVMQGRDDEYGFYR